MERKFLDRKTYGKSFGGSVGVPVLPVFPKSGGVISAFQLPGTTSITPVYFGSKRYELTDWLGNVRVVINDKKTPVNTGTVTVSYMPQSASVSDYYAFGSEITERNYFYTNTKYRYSFNGKESIEQRWLQDYGARYYHTVLGRFISADPLIVGQKKYAWLSSYQFASNSPIKFVDVDGLESGTNDEGNEGKNKIERKQAWEIYNETYGKPDLYNIKIEETTKKTKYSSAATGFNLFYDIPKDNNQKNNEKPNPPLITRKIENLDLFRKENRTNNRVDIQFEKEDVTEGNLIVRYQKSSEANSNQGSIEVGIVDPEGNEIPIFNQSFNNSNGEFNIDFQLNQGENLYYRSSGEYNLEIQATRVETEENSNKEKR